MVLGDAVVEGAAPEHHPSALARACQGQTVLADLVRSVLAAPHLSRVYSSAEEVLLELLGLDAAGVLRILPRACGDALAAYYATRRTGGDRSLSYVATYERNWTARRRIYDFVEACDANAARKAFQRDLYLQHLEGHLKRLPDGASVLDAGCGVGRLTGALLARGLRPTCVDASAEALKCAVRVGLHHGATVDSLDARLCDVRDLACFDAATFAATVALEVICYQEDATASLREIVRVTAPGGLVAVSVEGLHGSCIADPKLDPKVLGSVLDTAVLDIDHLISVHYFTKDGLRYLLESAGLEQIEIVGTHYTADGVFDRIVTDEVLADDRQVRELLAVERTAAANPVLEPLARAWLATARVSGAGR